MLILLKTSNNFRIWIRFPKKYLCVSVIYYCHRLTIRCRFQLNSFFLNIICCWKKRMICFNVILLKENIWCYSCILIKSKKICVFYVALNIFLLIWIYYIIYKIYKYWPSFILIYILTDLLLSCTFCCIWGLTFININSYIFKWIWSKFSL